MTKPKNVQLGGHIPISHKHVTYGADAFLGAQTGSYNTAVGRHAVQVRGGTDVVSPTVETFECPDRSMKQKTRWCCRGCVELDKCKPKGD
jgi:hypothetical protein